MKPVQAKAVWLGIAFVWACGFGGDPPPLEPPAPAAAEPRADMDRLSPYGWVDQDGRPFGPTDLRGHVWIVALMFASCPMACPVVAQRMAYLQTVLPPQDPSVRLLSITQDPENDTPAILAQYGRRFHRDPALWTFVTGDTVPAANAIAAGFNRANGPARSFDHGDTFALVDGEGHIRGYFGKDDGGVARLFEAAARLGLDDVAPGR